MTSRWLIGVSALLLVSSATISAQGQGRPGGAPPQGGETSPKQAQAANPESSAKPNSPARFPLSSGETVPVKDGSNNFQRDLLAPKDPQALAGGPVIEKTFADLYQLANVPADQRRGRLRDILGVPAGDALIYSEVADALLEEIAKLKPESRKQDDRFGLQIEFPGTDQAPKAAMTFGAAETDMKTAIDAAVTGIDVQVTVNTKAYDPIGESRSLECELRDVTRAKVTTAPIVSGYCVFPGLKVDTAFGRRTYYVAVVDKPGGQFKVDTEPSTDAAKPVVVIAGERTPMSAQVTVSAAGTRSATGSPVSATATLTTDPMSTVAGWAKAFPLLDAATQVLPANPGLHLGGVEVPGSGFHWIFALRYFLKPPTIDRHAKFVADAHGTFRLQLLTPLGTDVTEHQHYLKITWLAHADPDELSLSSRPTRQIPVGLTVGIVPSLTPTMYTVGVSFKLHPMLEAFAAAGIRKGLSTRLVYGFTVDIQKVAEFFGGPGKSAAGSGGKSQ